ncbi:hypothetical protein ACBJ59_58195 [Nonomuraea sp. MTCD27]|uniref:hypothetical protein n=1 Tax=Nonomuraea sp. MTCD27 TaxID=1676747 RepID=UPI0035C1C764
MIFVEDAGDPVEFNLLATDRVAHGPAEVGRGQLPVRGQHEDGVDARPRWAGVGWFMTIALAMPAGPSVRQRGHGLHRTTPWKALK